MFKDVWDYVYGSKSHMNIAGKILVGIPMAPIVFVCVSIWVTLNFLFTKKGGA